MDNNKIIELNKERIKVRIKPIQDQIHQGDPQILQQCNVYHDGKQISTKDIDFTKSCIFLCDKDFLGILGYLGILNINNIQIPDNTTTGKYSTIRTTYMTVNSPDIRFSKIEINEGYGYEEIDMPESYKPINFMHKELILWRLELDVGIGENSKMYRLCNQWIKDRYATNKLDWLFFEGKEEQFMSTYGNDLNLPVYHIRYKGSVIPNIKSRGQSISPNKVF